jgi:ABC-2 type transport system ATP-binding protein
MPDFALAFNGVVKRYKKQPVLNGLDLAVKPGEFFGLVGVNGAGKTTLIKSLLDFCEIDAGSIRIFGVDRHNSTARTRLAFLPERFAPPYYLKGKEFIQYMARLHGVRYDHKQVDAIFNALDLDLSLLQKSVREFSKGMAQKVGLAASFLSGKELLILDEPMSGLDPKARFLLKEYLFSLRTQGQTVFFSTHMLTDVEALCDRIGILHNGRVYFVGSPQQCCKQFDAGNLEQAYMRCIDEGARYKLQDTSLGSKELQL